MTAPAQSITVPASGTGRAIPLNLEITPPGINTLVERKTGLVCITKLQNKSCAATRTAIAHRFAPLLPRPNAPSPSTTDRRIEAGRSFRALPEAERTLLIRTTLGSGEPTRTPMASSVTTSRKELISVPFPMSRSPLLSMSSTIGPEATGLEDPFTSIRWCRLNVPYVDLTLVRVADILITRTFLPPPPTRVSLGTMSAGGVIAI